MDLDSQFATDRDAEVDGVWFEVGEDGELKIARYDNPVYARALRDATKGMEIQLELETLPDDVSNDVLAKAAAEGLLKDWKGITTAGKPLPYSVDNAKKKMTELPDFRRLVEKLSRRVDRFRAKQDAAAEKNSARSSGSTSASEEKS